MSTIARVVVDLAVGKELDYRIPDHLSTAIRLGARVVVPLGTRQATGYVVGLPLQSSHPSLKSILAISNDTPLLSEKMLALARWMGEYYCTPLESVLRAIIPAPIRRSGAAFKEQLFVSLSEAGATQTPGVAGKISRKAKLAPKQQAVLDMLQSRGRMTLQELVSELGITAGPVRTLQKNKWVNVESAVVGREAATGQTVLKTEPLALMPEQEVALDVAKRMIDSIDTADAPAPSAGSANGPLPASRVLLLYGVTGSGKTEVYLQAIDHVLQKGRTAIVLVPEISLTPQTVERFRSRFGGRIAVLHSHLSQGVRHDEWHRLKDGKADIAIGPRSAVFAPLPRLGLIVVDEEHENTYKQEDAPRYNARDLAVMRGKMEGCAVILGSATPSLESWNNARTGKYSLATLPRRADNRRMPVVQVVDMRLEMENHGHVSVFSATLISAIRSRLERKEQIILFLNRRGFASSLICPKCGYVANCKNCSVACTYHRSEEKLRCHICGHSEAVPARCPGCQDPSFKYTGMGTQRIEAVMGKFFPHARIQRMDADMTQCKGSHDRILGDFRGGKTDILIGTQMIAKGLHFPNVTLVGVIHADMSLHMPDFRSGERTLQLLAQVSGRAGRGEVLGEVIIQTYTPFHPAIQCARRLDYAGFCDQELEFRKELQYPPFSHLVCVTLKGASSERAAAHATAIAAALQRDLGTQARVSDAAPAPLARAKGLYRYQVVARARSCAGIVRSLRSILAGLRLPKDIACAIDVDAVNLL